MGVPFIYFQPVGDLQGICPGMDGAASVERGTFMIDRYDPVFRAMHTYNGDTAITQPGQIEQGAPEIDNGGYFAAIRRHADRIRSTLQLHQFGAAAVSCLEG